MTTPHAERLLSALGAELGIELSFQNGLCALVDEQQRESANIEVPPPGDSAIIHARVDLPGGRAGVYPRLLQLNFQPEVMGGCWLALDAQENVRLVTQCDLVLLDERRFTQWVLGYINRLEEVRKLLSR